MRPEINTCMHKYTSIHRKTLFSEKLNLLGLGYPINIIFITSAAIKIQLMFWPLFQNLVTMLAIVSNFVCYVGYCCKTLATTCMLPTVLDFGCYVGYCFKTLVSMLAIVSNFGYYVVYFFKLWLLRGGFNM